MICPVYTDLARFDLAQQSQQTEELVAEKRLDELYEGSVSEAIDDIEIASRDTKRPAAHRARLRAILSDMEDLLAESASYGV